LRIDSEIIRVGRAAHQLDSAVADHLPHTPAVIGHSLGGFVVQKYLESHAAPAAVLIASAPPQGAGAAMFRTAASLLRKTARHPWLTAKATLAGSSTPRHTAGTKPSER
jgi:hypothetical protein